MYKYKRTILNEYNCLVDVLNREGREGWQLLDKTDSPVRNLHGPVETELLFMKKVNKTQFS